MGNEISQKIDSFTQSHIKELKDEERKQGKKFTKYEIAQFMLSQNLLSQSDFASWMNTKEGSDSEIYSRMQKMAQQSGSIWGYNNQQSYLESFHDFPAAKPAAAPKWAKEDNQAREDAVNILSGIANTAYSKVKGYHDSIGYISFDAVWQGLNVIGDGLFDSITGRNDFGTVFEYEDGLQYEINKLNQLKSKTKKQNEFAKEFKNLYGIDFNPEAFKKLGEVNSQLNELNTCEALSKYFEFGIEKIKGTDFDSFEPAALLSPILGNDAKAYIDNLRQECQNDTELKEKLTQILAEAKNEADKKAKSFNREELEGSFKTAYKNAMGEYNADEITEKFITSSQTNAMLLETAAIIGTSLLTAGSATMLKLSSKAVKTLGTRAGTQVVKAGMTTTMAALPAAETIVGGLTSKEGLTLDKGKEAWEQLKSGLMYGAFGAYVSGPLGNAVQKVLSKNPNFFKSIISSHKFTLVAGTTTETTADVLFDRLTSDLSLKESLEQNGLMNFGMMIAGARMHGASQNASALSNVKIEKMKDGTYNIKENNRVLCKAKDENELAFVVLSLAKEKNNAIPEFKESLSDNEFNKTAKDVETKLKKLNKTVHHNWNKYNLQFMNKILSDETFYNNQNIMQLTERTLSVINTPEQFKLADKIFSDERLYNNEIVMKNASSILHSARGTEQFKLADKILSDERLYNNEIVMKNASSILYGIPYYTERFKLADKILSDENLYNNQIVMENASSIIDSARDTEGIKLADKILSDENLYNNQILMKEASSILSVTYGTERVKLVDKILSDEKLYNNHDFLYFISSYMLLGKQINPIVNIVNNYQKFEIEPERIPFLIENYKRITAKDMQKLYQVMGRKEVAKLSDSELLIAAQMVDICGKTNINEIPMEGKQNLLRKLVACNDGLFDVSDDLKKHFPLIPTDRETYCSLLPAIVKSLGVDIRTIEPPERITEFNQNMSSLASNLAKLSDTDFSNLQIRQEYSKDEFITNVLEKTKNLSRNERQKVYDYFGFELHHNKTNQTGFSITGYPVNLNNGKKLADITDPNTKAVVESLRPDVIRFSEQNPIKCNNPQVEKLLNDIVDIIPELRTEIGKTQHGAHDYDVFTHSLKVMQKVAQEPKFQTLNDSDKKIMMLASLLHDVTKKEGFSDRTHAAQGSFDTFFISKKFNLTRDEEIKLYTLTRHHEWLAYANTAKSEADLTKRLQSVAYDLQYDNLFDMALMFTHADLKAVKTDNSFHDTTIGEARTDFNGNVRSFGQSADIYAQRIRGYIDELKTSQPILPVTKVPRASKINQAITTVNPDGSTNIKGVYKRSDGLVVIKFNEVKDWEAIGFPQGSVSRGYTARAGSGKKGSEFTENVNTGNIKFFVHGLDYENQLAKFDAFSQIDSDVLLSVSYAERPESKYRFFRSQGVVLDFDTKYIHGGGNTDAGSGCGKFIENFKRDYVFGGRRESDRVYVSNLVKEATGMNDAEYVRFVEANKNKSLNEIEPPEYREPLIKAYASINSNTRKGDRAYNEMYGSNPREVMAVFAYDMDTNGTIGNPLDFLGKTEIGRADRGYNGAQRQSAYDRTKFLQDYAIEHDIPFIVFGD